MAFAQSIAANLSAIIIIAATFHNKCGSGRPRGERDMNTLSLDQ